MRSLSGIRKALGSRGALHYLHDYHQQRIDVNGTWQDALEKLEWYGPNDESKIAEHARFMDSCGSDFIKYSQYSK